jgi:ABC-2 type transport system permease protein
MSEPFLPLRRRKLLAAIFWLRWRLFINSLRTTRGQLELISRILVSLAFGLIGLGGALAMGILAYLSLSLAKPQFLPVFFWIVFFLWQLFPIMATAFTGATDSSDLLRFPLGYGSYFLVRLTYRAFDPASAIGSLWTLGIVAGVTFAKPSLFLWALTVGLAFIGFNLLFMQMIFAWVERWLAQRRSREIVGVLFVLALLSFQLLTPLTEHYRRRAGPQLEHILAVVTPVQGVLPPGLAADGIVQGIYPQWPVALSSVGLLAAYALAIAYALHVRLLAQYRGENLSEVSGASGLARDRRLRTGWNLPGFSSPVAAIFEKESRYLLRSGPMLFALIMPMVMLVLFRFGAMNSARHSVSFLSRTQQLAFPVAATYAILTLTNLAYNNFGGDAVGIQFLYASPVRFRDIVLGKNLTHAGILILEALFAWIAVSLLYRRPALDVTAATLAGLLFAAPLNFAVGNVLSVYSPRKIDYSKFGQQRASQLPALISIAVQLVIVGLGAATFWLASHRENFWIATLIFVLLSGVSFAIYATILARMDRLAAERRETMMAELCRA